MIAALNNSPNKKEPVVKKNLLLSYLLFSALIVSAQIQPQQQTKSEKMAIDAVNALPEVKKLFETYADSPGHFETRIVGKPDGKYYWIRVGQLFTGDSDDYYQAFLTHYEFYVTEKTNIVRNFDVLTNTPISLKKWRAKMKVSN